MDWMPTKAVTQEEKREAGLALLERIFNTGPICRYKPSTLQRIEEAKKFAIPKAARRAMKKLKRQTRVRGMTIENQYPDFRRNRPCPVKDCNDASGKPTKFKDCKRHYGLIPR